MLFILNWQHCSNSSEIILSLCHSKSFHSISQARSDVFFQIARALISVRSFSVCGVLWCGSRFTQRIPSSCLLETEMAPAYSSWLIFADATLQRKRNFVQFEFTYIRRRVKSEHNHRRRTTHKATCAHTNSAEQKNGTLWRNRNGRSSENLRIRVHNLRIHKRLAPPHHWKVRSSSGATTWKIRAFVCPSNRECNYHFALHNGGA